MSECTTCGKNGLQQQTTTSSSAPVYSFWSWTHRCSPVPSSWPPSERTRNWSWLHWKLHWPCLRLHPAARCCCCSSCNHPLLPLPRQQDEGAASGGLFCGEFDHETIHGRKSTSTRHALSLWWWFWPEKVIVAPQNSVAVVKLLLARDWRSVHTCPARTHQQVNIIPNTHRAYFCKAFGLVTLSVHLQLKEEIAFWTLTYLEFLYGLRKTAPSRVMLMTQCSAWMPMPHSWMSCESAEPTIVCSCT